MHSVVEIRTPSRSGGVQDKLHHLPHVVDAHQRYDCRARSCETDLATGIFDETPRSDQHATVGSRGRAKSWVKK